MKLSRFIWLLLCMFLQETAASSDKRQSGNRTKTLLKNCGKLFAIVNLASCSIKKPWHPWIESSKDGLNVCPRRPNPAEQFYWPILLPNSTERQNFEKYMFADNDYDIEGERSLQKDLFAKYLKKFPEISEPTINVILSKVKSGFNFDHVKQASKFFAYKYPKKAEAVEEALKDQYKGRDFEKLRRMLEYTKVFYDDTPNDRAKATTRALEILSGSYAEFSMDDFDQLVQYSKKVYPDTTKKAVQQAIGQMSYLKGFVYGKDEINFALADKVFPYYKAEHDKIAADVTEMEYVVRFATIYSSRLLIGADDIDHCVLRRVIKIAKKAATFPELQKTYFKGFGRMNAVKDALEAVGGIKETSHGLDDDIKPKITSRNIDDFEKSIALFENTLSHHMADNTKSTYRNMTTRQVAYDIAFNLSRDLPYKTIKAVYDNWYCKTCVGKYFRSPSNGFLLEVKTESHRNPTTSFYGRQPLREKIAALGEIKNE